MFRVVFQGKMIYFLPKDYTSFFMVFAPSSNWNRFFHQKMAGHFTVVPTSNNYCFEFIELCLFDLKRENHIRAKSPTRLG